MTAHNDLFKFGLVLFIIRALLSPSQIARAYEPSAHRLIVGRAITLYNQFGSSNEPGLYTQYIADGAENEDDWTDDHVFCYTLMHVTIPHFWNADGGIDDLVDMAGATWPNAWMKASGYRVDEFGLEPCLGSREGLWPQAVWYYRIGQKDVAYELLGHIAHLIADMSVPAHVHEHEHIIEDRYEELVSENMWWLLEGLDPEQLSLGLIPIPRAPNLSSCDWLSNFPLFYLMYTTNQRADFFASVHDECIGPAFCPGSEVWGDVFDFSGWINYYEYPAQMGYYQDPDHIDTPLWVCNNCGKLLCIGGDQCWPCIYCLSYNVAALNPVYLIAERCTLVYAVRATATLFELFVNATETTPPTTTLHVGSPKYYDGNDWHIAAQTQFTLTATDDKSGVNCTSYRISGYAYDSGWFIYTSPFDMSRGPDGTELDGLRYTIHYKSTDRAGNEEVEKQEEFMLAWVYNTTQNKHYNSIQAAIDEAVNGDEILAGPRTYNEAIDFKGKAITLHSSHGPELTTINGAGHYHVAQCVSGEDANTILEGFTITGGNANGPYPDNCGGGMYNYYSSPTVINCIFRGNTAGSNGGGMSNSPETSGPKLFNCKFIENTASQYGGGIYYRACYGLSNLTNCSFSRNTADSGGAIYNDWHSYPSLTNCSFSNNNATTNGGAISNTTNCYPKLTNCKFKENTAGQDGGGISNYGEGPGINLTNCTFSNNTATGRGGGIFNHACYDRSILTNCIFSANRADLGGAVCNNHYSYPRVTNCTFTNNSATNGGGMTNYNSSPTVTNCILWGNTPDEVNDVNSTPTVTYSDVQGGYSGTGNIDADPCFVDAGGGNLRLQPDSPCVDAGDNSAPGLAATDLDGHPRIIDGDCDDMDVVDMGVYELNYAYMGDLDYSCSVDFLDFSIFGRAWETEEGDPDWDWACDINEPPDDYIDWRDVAILCENWLTQIP